LHPLGSAPNVIPSSFLKRRCVTVNDKSVAHKVWYCSQPLRAVEHCAALCFFVYDQVAGRYVPVMQ